MSKINEQLKKELHYSVIKAISTSLGDFSKENNIQVDDELFFDALRYVKELMENELSYFD